MKYTTYSTPENCLLIATLLLTALAIEITLVAQAVA